MVPLPDAVKARIGEGGSEKRDYRNLYGYVLYLFAGIVKNTNMGLSGTRERAGVSEAEAHMLYALTAGTPE
jgi:hypothetical protein